MRAAVAGREPLLLALLLLLVASAPRWVTVALAAAGWVHPYLQVLLQHASWEAVLYATSLALAVWGVVRQ